MLTGVEILLERMKTNPEEFLEGAYSKWGRVMSMGRDFFTEEEREAMDSGLIQARREMFNSEVLRVLTGGDDEPNPYVLTTSGGYTTGMTNSINNAFNTAPSKIIASPSVAKQAKEILEKEFDKAYAEQDRILGLK